MKTVLLEKLNSRVRSSFPFVKINCISFLLGGSESPKDRADAKNFLAGLAEVTGGSLKLIDQN